MSDLPLREVKPGNLITASDWNQMIRKLKDVDGRLEKLEANPSAQTVVITQLVYESPLRMGQVLEIRGRNFGLESGALQLSFDGTLIYNFLEGSNDSRLIVVVPTQLPEIGENGRDVLLRVSNGGVPDSRTITIYPLDIPTSGNIVDVNQDTDEPVIPNPLQPNNGARLNFKANSRARDAVTFDVILTISDATLDAGKKLFTGNTEVTDFRLHLVPLTDLPFSIELPALPASLANSQFRVSIELRSGTMTGFRIWDFPVGSLIAKPDTIIVNPERFEVFETNGVPNRDLGRYDGGTIFLKVGNTGTMTLKTAFPEKDKYDYSIRITQGTGWSAVIGTGTKGSITIDDGDFAGGVTLARKDLYFNLSAPPPTSASGEIEFQVQRSGHAPVVVLMSLARL